MSAEGNLARQVQPGETIKPWLLLGPFYEDVSAVVHSASLFEDTASTLGDEIVAAAVAEAQALLSAQPREGEEAAYRGQRSAWTLVRRPEPYLSWGRFLKPHHLVAAFLTTVVTPETPGPQQWRLATRTPSRLLVAINGVLAQDWFAGPDHKGDQELAFDVDLQPGENVVTVALWRIGRMAQVGFQLAAEEGTLAVHAPLPEDVPAAVRQRVEEELAGVRLARDLFYPEHEIGVQLELAPTPETTLTVQLRGEDGRVEREAAARQAGPLALCRGAEVADGSYTLGCSWQDAAGRVLAAAEYAIQKTTLVPAPQGVERLEERKQRALQHFAEMPLPGPIWKGHIWREVARYALGRYDELDPQIIRETCDFIKSPVTGSDFEIQGVLRLMMWERQKQRLSAELNAMMDDAILNYKYWADEPGPSKYFGSENHRLMYHVAEMVAGQMFPLEEFANSRQRGLYHATKGRMFATEWLRQRGRYGFDEWHSNAYIGADIPPLINLYDFAIPDDYKLKQLAGAILDYLCFILAADTLEGVLGTTHGRSYGDYIRHPDHEANAPLCWLLYGTGSLSYLTGANATLCLATSDYAPPTLFDKIAHDREAVVEARERQGVLRGNAPHADFIVYRTPDYMMSGLQDHRKGEFESSTHVAQVTLPNKVAIFWSAPHTSDEGSGQRPDYWSGNTTQPRVVQYRNVMALTFRLNRWAWMSHCLFEQERMDEARLPAADARGGRWAFGRVGKGYVGIYSQHGFAVGDGGPYAGRELLCQARENTWWVECGREADWGSFDAFCRALSAARIEADGPDVAYASPSVGRFVTGWDTVPTVAGERIPLSRYPLVESPWAFSAFGSGALVVRYGEEVREIWMEL